METTRLCRFCRDFKLSDTLDGLRANDSRHVYHISHAEFFECASSCDICEVTAQHFLKNADPQANSEKKATAFIMASVWRDDGGCRLVFFYTGWQCMVSWAVWTSKGLFDHTLPRFPPS